MNNLAMKLHAKLRQELARHRDRGQRVAEILARLASPPSGQNPGPLTEEEQVTIADLLHEIERSALSRGMGIASRSRLLR